MLRLRHLEKTMKKVYWIFVLLSLTPGSAQISFAQCARGVVTVEGRLENPLQAPNAEVLVLLKTPKGDFSKTSVVAVEHFHVEVDFSTLKSWSPLSGHHCSNRPTLVVVTLRQAKRVLAQKSLKLADDFESRDSLSYSLKHELTLVAGAHGIARENPSGPKP